MRHDIWHQNSINVIVSAGYIVESVLPMHEAFTVVINPPRNYALTTKQPQNTLIPSSILEAGYQISYIFYIIIN